MNRRNFLGLFRGLVVLPFVKLPEATELLTDSKVEEVRQEYEALPPDASHITFDNRGSSGTITIRGIKTTRGDFLPFSQVQPGERIKLLDTDEVVSIGSAPYNKAS